MGLFQFISNLWHRRSSNAYINYLRSQGVHIGSNCIIRHPNTCRIDFSRPSLVAIGDNVDMNMNFQILTHDWASLVFRAKYHDFVNSSSHVTIGSNIYIGTNVTILKGVTIGDNCIIGAGSVVTKDIPSDSVAAGSPCKVICSLGDYYKKRKSVGLREAVEHVIAFKNRFGRYPNVSELREEFVYFVHKDNVGLYESLGCPIRFQLSEAYDDFLDRDEAPFKSYEDFIHYIDSIQ